jgi:hypothetical protein
MQVQGSGGELPSYACTVVTVIQALEKNPGKGVWHFRVHIKIYMAQGFKLRWRLNYSDYGKPHPFKWEPLCRTPPPSHVPYLAVRTCVEETAHFAGHFALDILLRACVTTRASFS